MTTDETVDCYNCGRSNPEWAQVCRSCGVPLRHGQARVVPTGRIPTDTNSLISIAAVIGVILGAVVLGIFLSSLNPTDPLVGEGAPTPTATPSPSAEPTAAPPSDTPEPTPSPTPALPGTIAFGSQLDANRQVTSPVETFTPPVAFAYSVTMPNGFGVSAIENEIAKIDDDGPRRSCSRADRSTIDPAATIGRLRHRHRRRLPRRVGARGVRVARVRRRNRRRARPLPLLRGLASRRCRRPRPRHRRRGERERAGSRGSCGAHRSRWWHRG